MKDKQKIELLKKCFEDTIWMAIRYADGRHNFAPGMVRDAVENFAKVFPEWRLRKDDTIEPPEKDVNFGFMILESDYLYDLFEKYGKEQ